MKVMQIQGSTSENRARLTATRRAGDCDFASRFRKPSRPPLRIALYRSSVLTSSPLIAASGPLTSERALRIF